MTMTIKLSTITAFASATLLAAGCGGGGIGGTGSTSGTLHVALTDAPACGYDAVNVTVEKIRVHQSSAAVDADSGWSEITLSPARQVDLLTLTNGVLEDLGQTALPTGKYTQLRLVLAPNDSVHPFANSVLPTGGALTALTTPSASQSGLKINLDLDVQADTTSDLVLDFDACKSVVRKGSSGQFNLKPVIAAIPVLSDAGQRVVGYVDPALGLTSTIVSVQSGGVPVKSTLPDAAGKFVLYPVPVGAYDLVVTSVGRATAVMTAVPVTTTEHTNVNSAALPIAPPALAASAPNPRSVAGSVTPAADATVRATQSFSDGTRVEVATSAVDAIDGGFSFALAVDASVKTAYVPNPTALGFVADTSAGSKGRYTIEATSGGVVKTQAVDVSAAVAPVVFAFP